MTHLSPINLSSYLRPDPKTASCMLSEHRFSTSMTDDMFKYNFEQSDDVSLSFFLPPVESHNIPGGIFQKNLTMFS